jgi:CxxC motif-containing protein (DUF1111 family)
MASLMRQLPTKANKTAGKAASDLRVVINVLILALVAMAIPASAEPKLPDSDLHRLDLTETDIARVKAVTAPAIDFSKAEPFEAKPGGAATTTKLPNRDIFSQHSANLSFEQARNFKLGNALFRKVWVSSPASTKASDGLGPLFNARACQSCHLKDGRGNPMEVTSDASSTFFRLARPARNDLEKAEIDALKALNFPDPVYGSQVQDRAVPGLKGEAQMLVSYTETPVMLKDGTSVSLRKPMYSLDDLAYGPLEPDVKLSPRIANPMIGLGLLQAIHPADILAIADPDDTNSDGISGKANLVRDNKDQVALGRFGWKAQNPSIREQTAEAFAGDIGISSPDVPDAAGDCTSAQTDCQKAVSGVQDNLGATEAPDPILELVTFYSENLAVPARRNVDDPQVLQGKALFYASGCASCHTPKFVTRRDAGYKEHAFQLIWPYTDMLLHDMGEGLADGQPVGLADGREWRTPPLWGIGLTQTVSGHTNFLHDGRARNLTEAILWHGGEAQASRDQFSAMIKSDRDALIAFLESL